MLEHLQKLWFKRLAFYALLVVAIIIGYFVFRFGIIYNTIVVDNNSSVWTEIKTKLFGPEKQPTNDPFPMPTPEVNREDVLILGIRGYDKTSIEQEGGLLTDTMLVASVDKVSKKAALVSIPRDLYIDILDVKGKINEAYERGLERKQDLDLVKQIVSKITGIYIDKAVVFDFNAFQHIVESLGGVDIYLAKPFVEKSQWGYEFSLPAGLNHLSGEQALYYVRSRYSTNDFDRARRQQEVIAAIKNKLIKNGYLSNPVKLTNLMSDIKGDVRTDFQIWDVKDLLDLANTFSAKTQVKEYILSTDNLLYETKSAKGEYILLPKENDFNIIKQQFLNILN